MTLRRFRHLEGQRPDRDEAAAGGPANARFEAVSRPAGQREQVVCARCGHPIADALAACAACAGGVQQSSSPREARFQTVAGNGPLVLAREVPTRTEEAHVAATVPAWRGEAMPDDVAEEVRQKLGLSQPLPPAGRDDALAWADRELQARRDRNLVLLLGGAWMARRAIGALLVFPVVVIVFLKLWLGRGCS